MVLQSLLDLGRFFSPLILYTQSVGLLGRVMNPSQGRYLHTEEHKQNKRTQTSTPWVGFEPTIPAFERAKIVHALNSASTVFDNITASISRKQQKRKETDPYQKVWTVRTAITKSMPYCGLLAQRFSSTNFLWQYLKCRYTFCGYVT
jgi:hypothetical protein